jgi:ribosome maturation factor RimP
MTREPVAGNRHFQGRLKTVDAERIALDLETEKKKGKRKQKVEPEQRAIEIEMSNIERAHLVPEF